MAVGIPPAGGWANRSARAKTCSAHEEPPECWRCNGSPFTLKLRTLAVRQPWQSAPLQLISAG
jgi:hypothetical protein